MKKVKRIPANEVSAATLILQHCCRQGLNQKFLKKEETAKLACKKWFDVRAFGQLFAFGKQDDASRVSISFLTRNRRFLAIVKGPVSGNVLLRRKQFRMADCKNISAQMAGFCPPTGFERGPQDQRIRVDHRLSLPQGPVS